MPGVLMRWKNMVFSPEVVQCVNLSSAFSGPDHVPNRRYDQPDSCLRTTSATPECYGGPRPPHGDRRCNGWTACCSPIAPALARVEGCAYARNHSLRRGTPDTRANRRLSIL